MTERRERETISQTQWRLVGLTRGEREGGRGYLGVLAGREGLMARREPLLSLSVKFDHLDTWHVHIVVVYMMCYV